MEYRRFGNKIIARIDKQAITRRNISPLMNFGRRFASSAP